jgi:hypothetical protein
MSETIMEATATAYGEVIHHKRNRVLCSVQTSRKRGVFILSFVRLGIEKLF